MASFCSVAILVCRRLLPALCFPVVLAACTTGIQFAGSGKDGGGEAPPTEIITEQLIESERRVLADQSPQDLSPLIVTNPAPYTIGQGDVLSIVVWDHPELAGSGMTAATAAVDSGTAPPNAVQPGFAVDHMGRIQFPLIGLLHVEGQTEEQARSLLTKKLARYIAQPSLTLRVQSYRSKRVYIDGEVKAPGLQAINDIPMTLVEALNRAGGMLPSADQSRIVIERGPSRYMINLRDLVQKGVNPGTVMLRHGDVVRVHSRDESKVFVSGEVVTPRALTMHNGSLTLHEAIVAVGGVWEESGDEGQISDVRMTP
jgi:polysaccharide export outer membrane protein